MMKEDLILIKDIRQGCYSEDYEERKNNSTGFMMKSGARYVYAIDPNWNGGKGFYYCGTHIILEQNIDMSMFIKASKYNKFVDKLKKEIENQK